MIRAAWLTGLFIVVWTFTSRAASVEPWTLEERFKRADAVFAGQVVELEGRRDAADQEIYTRAIVRVHESFKGLLPEYMPVLWPGGIVDGEGLGHALYPSRSLDQPVVFFIWRTTRGAELLHGDADLVAADQAHLQFLHALKISGGEDFTKMGEMRRFFNTRSVTSNGVYEQTRRFTRVDRGEPIPVIPDLEYLPAGIDTNEALTALQRALSAWEEESSLLFSLQTPQVFGVEVSEVRTDEEVIRVQFHDTYGDITNSSGTLGIGGARFLISEGGGGVVKGLACYPSLDGRIKLNHDKTSLQDPVTLEAVLAHEVGHVIGLTHSSETGGETNSLLAEAIMFYAVHIDGRGASLNAWDTGAIGLLHPLDNVPPYGFYRSFLAVTSPTGLVDETINTIQLTGADLDGDALTLLRVDTNDVNGIFSVEGDALTYYPSSFFGDFDGSFDRFDYRWSDGTNQSPIIKAQITGFRADQYPLGRPDGLPDSWMTNYFGSTTPVAGYSEVDDDPDGDRLTNLQEFRLGSDPLNADDCFDLLLTGGNQLDWSYADGAVYRIEFTSNMTDWVGMAWLPAFDGSVSPWTIPDSTNNVSSFYRVTRDW